MRKATNLVCLSCATLVIMAACNHERTVQEADTRRDVPASQGSVEREKAKTGERNFIVNLDTSDDCLVKAELTLDKNFPVVSVMLHITGAATSAVEPMNKTGEQMVGTTSTKYFYEYNLKTKGIVGKHKLKAIASWTASAESSIGEKDYTCMTSPPPIPCP